MTLPTTSRAFFAFLATFSLAQAAPPPGAARPDAKLVTVARVPDAGVQPQAATDRDGVTHVIYFSGEAMHGDVFYIRSPDAVRRVRFIKRPQELEQKIRKRRSPASRRGANFCAGRFAEHTARSAHLVGPAVQDSTNIALV